MSPSLRIEDIALFARDVPFTRPFRFGDVTVAAAAEAFVRVEVTVEGHGRATGASAELLVPRWFDKDKNKSIADTMADLAWSLESAARAYRGRSGTAFGLHADAYARHRVASLRHGLPDLAAAFGPAEIDKAVLDALFRAVGVGAWTGLRRNLAGIDARLTPDLDDSSIAAFLSSRVPAETLAVRHTMGFVDPVEDLLATLMATGCRYLKLKLSGDVEADEERLTAIAAVLPDGVMGVSLDGNEQYAPALLPALDAVLRRPALAPIERRLLYVEQPLARSELDGLGAFAGQYICLLDEGDDRYEAFPLALGAGWRGVSAKSCKGTYKAILNALRAERAGAMLTAEDLTTQPGLALQQDLALAGFLGVTHIERNGHCYTAGFVDAEDAARFGAAYPALYHAGQVRLTAGSLPTAGLGGAIGYGSEVHPDWSRLQTLATTFPVLHEGSCDG